MGKIGHIKAVGEDIALRRVFAPVDIHGIGDDLEGEIGDAQRRRELPSSQGLELHSQQGQHAGSHGDPHHPAVLGDQAARQVAEHRGRQDIGKARDAVAGVDHQAR